MRAKWLGVVAWCLTVAGCSGDDAPSDDGMTAAGTGNPAGAASGGGGSGSTPTAGTGTGVGGTTPVGNTGGGGSGSAGRGGQSTGGSSTTGGTTGTGAGPTVQSCSSVGETIEVEDTIDVGSGEVFDGKCNRYVADPEKVGDGSQEEGQKPVFELADGATLINVVLGAPAADGIHTKGDATLKSIVWQDIGEDALTVDGEGTVVLDGGSAQKGADKVFQINAASTFKVSNFVAKDAGKFIRQNGGTGFTAKVFIDKCDISDMAEAIFRTDSSSSTVSMTNTRYSGIGESLFIGVSESNITEQNNTKY
jgi:pectate lyase C